MKPINPLTSLSDFAQAISPRRGVLVVGDYLLDTYQFGDVWRISPEAPVPIFKFQREEYRPGGAGNVVANLHALNIYPECAGIVGKDLEGEKLTWLLSESFKAGTGACVLSEHRPTPLKTRLISRNQQIVRIDREESTPLHDSERLDFNAKLSSVAQGSDLVFVSDYGKGVVEPDLVDRIRRLNSSTWIAVDPKGAEYEKYRGCNLITPNEFEAKVATGLDIQSELDVAACLRKLYEITSAPYICMTRHEKGMSLYQGQRDRVYHQKALSQRDVFDVTGAGDTVLVFLGLALSSGLAIESALTLASLAASIVIQKFGASTATLDELRSTLSHPVVASPFSKKMGAQV